MNEEMSHDDERESEPKRRDEDPATSEPSSEPSWVKEASAESQRDDAASLAPVEEAPVEGTAGPGEAAPIPSDLPQPAVGRLSLYYRELRRMHESGVTSLNSQELGRVVDVSPAVVRRDLSALGTIGRRGVGYDVATLIERIGAVLGSGVRWNVVLVGVGSLGDALLRYRGFQRLGFHLSAAFDNDPSRIGTLIGGMRVLNVADLESTLASQPAELAILAVPAEQAAEVAGRLVACGISGILNFAPTTLRLSGDVAIVNVDLACELQRLAFTVHTKK